MSNQIYQCCYTNEQGWRSVAVSKDIPEQAYKNCVTLQSRNSSIAAKVDELGNTLNLFEVAGDDRFVYISRTQYGLLDSSGRANIFAHAFIMPWAEQNALRDPNVYLTIENANFKYASKEIEESIQLTRMKGFSLREAMEQAKLTPESYVTLIDCIYAQMFLYSPKRPLYVKYDGTEIQMRALLYCIYSGLPHYMRKIFSASSSATVGSSESKTVVFTRFPEKYDTCFIPETGENTVLTGRMIQNIQYNQYVDYAVKNLEQLAYDTEFFFEKLDQKAASYGDTSASDENLLRLIMTMPEPEEFGEISSYSEEKLKSQMYEALKLAYSTNKQIEGYMAALLDEYRKRDLELGEVSRGNLNKKLNETDNKILKEAGKEYQIAQLNKMSEEEFSKNLSRLEEKRLNEYVNILAQSKAGREKVDYFYFHTVLGKQSDWNVLQRTWNQIKELPELEKTVKEIKDRAYMNYETAIKNGEYIIKEYHQYSALMRKMLGENREKIELCEEEAKKRYWAQFDWRKISSLKSGEYEEFKLPPDKNENCDICSEYLKLFDIKEKNDHARLIECCNDFLWSNITRKNIIVNELREKLLQDIETEDANLNQWIEISLYVENKDHINQLIQIYKMVSDFSHVSFGNLLEYYLNAKKTISESKAIVQLQHLLINICLQYEAERPGYVPLDMWISLSEMPFSTGQDYWGNLQREPKIFSMDPEEVVRDSEKFRDRDMLERAKKYNGMRKDVIHKWIKAVEKGEKQKVKAEKKIKKMETEETKPKCTLMQKWIDGFGKRKKEDIFEEEIDYRRPSEEKKAPEKRTRKQKR